jgi:hypothetical protein
MKTNQTDNDVLRAIRKVRKKHYKETKNMSIAERMEYDHQKSEKLREKLSQMNFDEGRYEFSFSYPKREKNNEKENT